MTAISQEPGRLRDQLHNRLKTTGMALGLARLLRDAGRTHEARAILQSIRDRSSVR